jgi:small-conductance mechanosensitive channel
MAISPVPPVPQNTVRTRIFGNIRIAILCILLALLIACALFSWTTRDAMVNLQFLRDRQVGGSLVGGHKALVDLHPWQTAQQLAPLAMSMEEKEFASEAERLADHEVDQAFASALRQARLKAQNRVLTGDALELSQKVAGLEQTVRQDQALVANLTAQSTATTGAQSSDDLEVAKAQLGLDSDELTDAQSDLERASGDLSSQIQAELTAREAAMRKYDNRDNSDGQVALVSAQQHKTLATRIQSWFNQRSRHQQIEQAIQQTQTDVASLTAEHNALASKVDATAAASPTNAADHAAFLANIKARSAERQILSIYDDRIQTEQQLAGVYTKWSAQVLLQHRIVFHLILSSVMVIIGIAIGMVLLGWLVRRLMSHPALADRRQTQTLRSILELSIQVLGAVLILLVIFGTPKNTPTILGLGTAALTIALQDFILAFLGWFVLMGRNGIHVGDLVEIDGVDGEVTEVGLFRTTLLETGNLADVGHLTGRRITFINSYAIRGKFFNFSTTGQWMWDELTVSLPASADIHSTTERIREAVVEETKENARAAEQDWIRAKNGASTRLFSGSSILSLRPSAAGIDVVVRFVTRASERFEVRDRLYQHLINLLQKPSSSTTGTETRTV